MQCELQIHNDDWGKSIRLVDVRRYVRDSTRFSLVSKMALSPNRAVIIVWIQHVYISLRLNAMLSASLR